MDLGQAEKKFWKMRELVERLLLFLDLSSTLHLVQARERCPAAGNTLVPVSPGLTPGVRGRGVGPRRQQEVHHLPVLDSAGDCSLFKTQPRAPEVGS